MSGSSQNILLLRQGGISRTWIACSCSYRNVNNAGNLEGSDLVVGHTTGPLKIVQLQNGTVLCDKLSAHGKPKDVGPPATPQGDIGFVDVALPVSFETSIEESKT